MKLFNCFSLFYLSYIKINTTLIAESMLDRLPAELLLHIFKFADLESQFATRACCRALRAFGDAHITSFDLGRRGVMLPGFQIGVDDIHTLPNKEEDMPSIMIAASELMERLSGLHTLVSPLRNRNSAGVEFMLTFVILRFPRVRFIQMAEGDDKPWDLNVYMFESRLHLRVSLQPPRFHVDLGGLLIDVTRMHATFSGATVSSRFKMMAEFLATRSCSVTTHTDLLNFCPPAHENAVLEYLHGEERHQLAAWMAAIVGRATSFSLNEDDTSVLHAFMHAFALPSTCTRLVLRLRSWHDDMPDASGLMSPAITDIHVDAVAEYYDGEEDPVQAHPYAPILAAARHPLALTIGPCWGMWEDVDKHMDGTRDVLAALPKPRATTFALKKLTLQTHVMDRRLHTFPHVVECAKAGTLSLRMQITGSPYDRARARRTYATILAELTLFGMSAVTVQTVIVDRRGAHALDVMLEGFVIRAQWLGQFKRLTLDVMGEYDFAQVKDACSSTRVEFILIT